VAERRQRPAGELTGTGAAPPDRCRRRSIQAPVRRCDSTARDGDGFSLLRRVVTNVLTRPLTGLTMTGQSVRLKPRKRSTMMWRTADATSD
jgi:hypothetical protein